MNERKKRQKNRRTERQKDRNKQTKICHLGRNTTGCCGNLLKNSLDFLARILSHKKYKLCKERMQKLNGCFRQNRCSLNGNTSWGRLAQWKKVRFVKSFVSSDRGSKLDQIGSVTFDRHLHILYYATLQNQL